LEEGAREGEEEKEKVDGEERSRESAEKNSALEAIAKRLGERATVQGWVHDVRLLGGINFILLRNSDWILQITAPKKAVSKEVLDAVTALHPEDVIRSKGLVKEAKMARNGFEIIPESIEVLSAAAVPLPLDPRGVTDANLDTRLNWRTLDLRRPEVQAIFRIQDALLEGMESFLRENGFLRIFTPSILGGVSEGGAEVFKTDYYGRPAFLRQDPQLHRQLAILGGLGRVYDLGPSWRAEVSHTPRHMSEHRTIAPELSFIKDERDTMRVEEGMVVAGLKRANKKCGAELDLLEVELDVPDVPFPEVSFPEVYELLKRLGHELRPDQDLDRESEKLLTDYVADEYGSDFFFVNRFPSAVKPFYVMHVDDDPRFARSVDMLYRGLELSSGGQREHRHAKIVEQIREKGLDEQGLAWFTEPFRYGAPSHGGFSLGIERFTAELLNIENVKEAALFPRDPERLQP
jgi:nondiscriminating aspartyl-tRNA synthetase